MLIKCCSVVPSPPLLHPPLLSMLLSIFFAAKAVWSPYMKIKFIDRKDLAFFGIPLEMASDDFKLIFWHYIITALTKHSHVHRLHGQRREPRNLCEHVRHLAVVRRLRRCRQPRE